MIYLVEGKACPKLSKGSARQHKRPTLRRPLAYNPSHRHSTLSPALAPFAQVTLLPRTYPGAAAPEASTALKTESPDEVDRRPAWTWAPMSLSEIRAADAAAANPAAADPAGNAAAGTTIGHEAAAADKTQRHRQDGGPDEEPAPPDPSDRGSSEEWPPAGSGQDVGLGYDALESGNMDFEGEEGDGGGAGGRARQRLKAGGRRMQAGQGREADLSVRYLMTKVTYPSNPLPPHARLTVGKSSYAS